MHDQPNDASDLASMQIGHFASRHFANERPVLHDRADESHDAEAAFARCDPAPDWRGIRWVIGHLTLQAWASGIGGHFRNNASMGQHARDRIAIVANPSNGTSLIRD